MTTFASQPASLMEFVIHELDTLDASAAGTHTQIDYQTLKGVCIERFGDAEFQRYKKTIQALLQARASELGGGIPAPLSMADVTIRLQCFTFVDIGKLSGRKAVRIKGPLTWKHVVPQLVGAFGISTDGGMRPRLFQVGGAEVSPLGTQHLAEGGHYVICPRGDDYGLFHSFQTERNKSAKVQAAEQRLQNLTGKTRDRSISGRLRLASFLVKTGAVDGIHRGTLKDLIFQQDRRLEEALDAYENGDNGPLTGLLEASYSGQGGRPAGASGGGAGGAGGGGGMQRRRSSMGASGVSVDDEYLKNILGDLKSAGLAGSNRSLVGTSQSFSLGLAAAGGAGGQ
eukprot:g5333.t1